MSGQTRLAFIGLGPMGKDLLREALTNPKAEVVALCDMEPEALAAGAEIAGAGPVQYSDYARMLSEETLDGVVVAVPQYLHGEVSIDVLNACLNVFCEKPMALNVTQCESMIAAAQKTGKSLMIGQVLRYIGPFRYVLELAQSGELGRPLAMRGIRSMYRWGGWMRPWRRTYAMSGGLLLEVNVHEIDLMLQIMGPATSVSAIAKHFVNDEIDYEDFISANIVFANGGLGSITSVQCDYAGKSNAEIYFENGTIYYESLGQTVHVARDGENKEVIPYAEVHPEWESGTYREIREFIETCLGEHPVTIPAEDGMRAVEIGQAAYLSARENRPVTLPLPRKQSGL